MALRCSRAAGRFGLAIALFLVVGCGSSESDAPEDYLLRVGNRRVTTREFLQALGLAKTAYPGGVDLGSTVLQDARRHLLDELTTELIILNRAEEVGITVSENELEAAINTVKADYPPGAFEQTLAEAAVPFEAWKQRMRARLLLEKLVEFELVARITVDPEELVEHYDQHYRGNTVAAESEERFRRLKDMIVADVRRQKLEDVFADWVEGLKARYPVQVNAQQWEALDGQPSAASSAQASE